jgi:hypothetical protein
MLARRLARSLIATLNFCYTDSCVSCSPVEAGVCEIVTKCRPAHDVENCISAASLRSTRQTRFHTDTTIAHSDVKSDSSLLAEEIPLEEQVATVSNQLLQNAAECAAKGQFDRCGQYQLTVKCYV